jgi:hypothetical protein
MKIAKPFGFLGLHGEEWVFLAGLAHGRYLFMLEQLFIFRQGREEVLPCFQRQS